MKLPPPPEVVTLTACKTGLGSHVSGEGVMGMGRTFQYARGQNVLMSLWILAEDATVKLFQRLLQRLEGWSKIRGSLEQCQGRNPPPGL